MVELELRARNLTPVAAVQTAATAERAGLHAVCLPDGPALAPFTTASAVAVNTERLAVRASGVDLRTRSTALVAMAAVTVHSLAAGRFALSVIDDLDAITALDTATRGSAVAHAGGFRLSGIEPAPLPIYLESASTDAVVHAVEAGVAGVVLHAATPPVVRELASISRAHGCRVVAALPLSSWSAVDELLTAGADAVRLVPPPDTDLDALHHTIWELGHA
jgi:hypothetical protein